jgi:hypothetical protein
MAFRPEHELHRRRFGRNLGVGLALAGFAAVVFAITVVKISGGSLVEGYDHRPRASLLPAAPAGAEARP